MIDDWEKIIQVAKMAPRTGAIAVDSQVIIDVDNIIKQLKEENDLLADKLDCLKRIATNTSVNLNQAIKDFDERYGHDKDCPRRRAWRKESWPCSCITKKYESFQEVKLTTGAIQ